MPLLHPRFASIATFSNKAGIYLSKRSVVARQFTGSRLCCFEGRIINILPATHGDDRCCTPPGDLWGPMHHDVQSEASHSPPSCATFLQLESVLRPVMLTDSGNYVLTQSEKYSPAHFEEMGRGLLIGALDMWGVNPWSRLIHSPCADLLKHAAGTYRNLRTITSLGFNLNGAGGGSCIGATSSTSNLKLAPIPSRLSQSKTMNLKVS